MIGGTKQDWVNDIRETLDILVSERDLLFRMVVILGTPVAAIAGIVWVVKQLAGT